MYLSSGFFNLKQGKHNSHSIISDPENTYYESGSLTSIDVLNGFSKFCFARLVKIHTKI